MLEERPFVGFLLITDPARAKEFYCDVLGLSLRHEDDFAVVVDAGGTPLRLSIVAEVPEPGGYERRVARRRRQRLCACAGRRRCHVREIPRHGPRLGWSVATIW